jgi:alkaline phosphatase D
MGAQRLTVNLSKERDLAATLVLAGLEPATTYRFRIVPGEVPGRPIRKRVVGEGLEGTFMTAPPPTRSQPATILWSADLGGQQRCRRDTPGYPIFETMRQARPAFALLLGDTTYGDDRCPSPPNMPGGDFIGTSLETFRDKHRYQRGATDLQRFLREVPVVVTWDDHEVRNNFSGAYEPLMAFGRQAFLEYWPIVGPPNDLFRIHRSLRWGRDVELFVLDTRQHRSYNAEPDGPGKSMLGGAQRDWLLEGLTRSTATWKLIVSSVPVSIPKPGSKLIPGIDSWAKGEDGTGFGNELARIVRVIMDQPVRNVVWLTADVHYPQINAYDADDDGTADFHEFVAGPLSANPGRLAALDQTFHPTTLYTDTGFYNFGKLSVDGQDLRVEIIDETGAVHYSQAFKARH